MKAKLHVYDNMLLSRACRPHGKQFHFTRKNRVCHSQGSVQALAAATACLHRAWSACRGQQLISSCGPGKVSEPEVFPRADGTVWCCGENSMVVPPEDPLQVVPLGNASAAIQVCTSTFAADNRRWW